LPSSSLNALWVAVLLLPRAGPESSALAQAPPADASAHSAESPHPDVSTAGWKLLVNNYGWSVRYPPSWKAEPIEADSAEAETQPIISGPPGCYEAEQECGQIQIGASPRLYGERATQSAKDELLEHSLVGQRTLIEQGETVLGGQPAYFVVYRDKLYGGYPGGLIFKEVETKYADHLYFMTFYEEGKNASRIAAINSPNGWALEPIFEGIAASFKIKGADSASKGTVQQK